MYWYNLYQLYTVCDDVTTNAAGTQTCGDKDLYSYAGLSLLNSIISIVFVGEIRAYYDELKTVNALEEEQEAVASAGGINDNNPVIIF